MTTIARSPATAPGRLPVVGHALQMKRRPGDFLLSLQDSGDAVTIIQLGPKQMYVVNEPGLIRELLRDPETFARGGPITERFRMMFGNGLGISEGDFHRRQRAIIQPAFDHSRIMQYTERMSEVVAQRTAGWPDGGRLAVDKEMDNLALTNVTQVIFSADTAIDIAEFVAATTVLLGGLFRRMTDTIGLTKLPTPANLRYRAATEYLRRTINQVISDYRASGVDRGDLLSTMLYARTETGEPAMSDQQLHDEVMTFFIAGSNTVSNTLSWALHEIATHPEVERRLHEEVDQLAGRPAGYHDVAQLDYTRRVITETLRKRTQGLFLSRMTTRDTDLGGYRIPAGTDVLYSFHALNHNPVIHADPERFDPDRWLHERAKAIPRGAFMPFSVGVHGCIGDQFAWVEMIVLLATITARWRLASVPGHQPKPKLAITMPVDSLPMIAHRRRVAAVSG
jgi:cyclooctat-9-en-7-ol 5-monooxygenase